MAGVGEESNRVGYDSSDHLRHEERSRESQRDAKAPDRTLIARIGMGMPVTPMPPAIPVRMMRVRVVMHALVSSQAAPRPARIVIFSSGDNPVAGHSGARPPQRVFRGGRVCPREVATHAPRGHGPKWRQAGADRRQGYLKYLPRPEIGRASCRERV